MSLTSKMNKGLYRFSILPLLCFLTLDTSLFACAVCGGGLRSIVDEEANLDRTHTSPKSEDLPYVLILSDNLTGNLEEVRIRSLPYKSEKAVFGFICEVTSSGASSVLTLRCLKVDPKKEKNPELKITHSPLTASLDCNTRTSNQSVEISGENKMGLVTFSATLFCTAGQKQPTRP